MAAGRRRRPRHRACRPSGAQFVAGQLHAARQLAWCFAPYVNSYRRYVPDSWAPTAVVWGEDNRTCGFRTVGTGAGRRVESRIPGADVNPYLALAATIAGGLWGIEHELELEPAFTGNAYEAAEVPRIPSTLVEAIDRPGRQRGGGRGLRRRGPPPSAQHRPAGVGRGQPGGHRLGAGPQLRAHLIPPARAHPNGSGTRTGQVCTRVPRSAPAHPVTPITALTPTADAGPGRRALPAWPPTRSWWFVARAAGPDVFFRRVEVEHGERLESGRPTVLVVNHRNGLVDGLLLMAALRPLPEVPGQVHPVPHPLPVAVPQARPGWCRSTAPRTAGPPRGNTGAFARARRLLARGRDGGDLPRGDQP